MALYNYYRGLVFITCILPFIAFVAAVTAITIVAYIQSLLKYFKHEEN